MSAEPTDREIKIELIAEAVCQEINLWPAMRNALRTLAADCRQEFRSEIGRKVLEALS